MINPEEFNRFMNSILSQNPVLEETKTWLDDLMGGGYESLVQDQEQPVSETVIDTDVEIDGIFYEEGTETSLKRVGRGKKRGRPSGNVKPDTDTEIASEEYILAADSKIIEDMKAVQDEYEKSLMEYTDDAPQKIFKHNFLMPRYLNVKTIHHEKAVCDTDLDSVAERMVKEAYDIGKGGSAVLNHVRFCNIWYETFKYVYCGYILTPKGKIDPEVFKSDIIKMLFRMKTEQKNIDSTAEHIYKTYTAAYSMDAYTVTNMIPFKNGDLYINEDKKGFTFHENEKSPVPYRFNYEFHNVKNCLEPEFPYFKMWRDALFDEDDIYTLKQLLGYLLIPINTAQEAFFIIGKAGTGKSILTDCVIPDLLGDAYFPMSIQLFFNDKFQLGTSEGKLCMVDDDIGETMFSKDDSGRFKNFVTAEQIQIEHKYCNPVFINNSARIVCAGNHMINSKDKSDGFTRRLHPIYVKPRDVSNPDRRLRDKISGEIESIVLWALEGLLELLNQDGVPYTSNRTLMKFDNYSENQKWEEQFIIDCFTYKKDEVSYSSDIRDALNEWLKDNGELAGEGTLHYKHLQVSKWLKEEGADKFGFVYKRGIKRGDNYNARGFINMKPKEQVKNPTVWLDETGKLKIKVGKKVDSGKEE